MPPRLLGLLLLCFLPALPAVVQVHVEERTDVLDGKAFGAAGPYERIVGKVHFAVDPKLPANRIISDIDLAPRNEDGLVEFSADLYMLKPIDSAKGNGTVLFEVVNRGRKRLLVTFNLATDAPDPVTAADFGDGLLLEQGFTLAWIGWQFAREENGKPVPDRTHVFMADGFQPGKLYDVVYTAQDPVLVGLGLAAVRDFVSFLKHGAPRGGTFLLGDQRRYLKHAVGFGISQSGRFLRTYLYDGFNADEEGRQVFDGIYCHVAGGGRGSFNHRFAQPSRDGHSFLNTFYPTDIFPFADLDQTDPETGLSGGILKRAAEAGVVPKIFYTNSAYEYWGRAASLTHTTIDGKQDAPLAEHTRFYLFTGTQHVPAAFPPGSAGMRNLANPNDFRWPMRALLLAMQRWVAGGADPPAPRFPRITTGELVPLSADTFPKIPGVEFPKRMLKAYRVDYGPDFRTKHIVSIEPPKVGKPFPMLLPQVDADGNETSGIRMPEVAVPLATYTGWNLRDPSIGAPDELYSMAGSFIPFARTRTGRENAGDPRPSIEERYHSREDYLKKIETAARDLVHGGYLLERDVKAVVEHAGRRWDFIMASPDRVIR